MAMIAAGLGLGIKAWDGVEFTSLFVAHLVLGFLAVALAKLQVTALVYRPNLDAPIRCRLKQALSLSLHVFQVLMDKVRLAAPLWHPSIHHDSKHNPLIWGDFLGRKEESWLMSHAYLMHPSMQANLWISTM